MGTKKTVPEFFKPILWSVVFSELNPHRDIRYIVVQTINYGSKEHWNWITQTYGRPKIRRLMKEIAESEFDAQKLKYAMGFLGIKKMKYATRSDYIRQKLQKS